MEINGPLGLQDFLLPHWLRHWRRKVCGGKCLAGEQTGARCAQWSVQKRAAKEEEKMIESKLLWERTKRQERKRDRDKLTLRVERHLAGLALVAALNDVRVLVQLQRRWACQILVTNVANVALLIVAPVQGGEEGPSPA